MKMGTAASGRLDALAAASVGRASPEFTVVVVATASGEFRILYDDELLALLADKPASLIRTGPNSEELVFANPQGQKKYLFR